MVEPFDITPRYFVFSSLVQGVYSKFLVGTSVFQYVIAHDKNLMSCYDNLSHSPHPPNNYYTAFFYSLESSPFNYFLSMKIQECDELLVWELPIVIVWLWQFWDFLRTNNLLKMRCYAACL